MIVLTPGRHSELLTGMVMVIYQVKTSSHSLRNKYYIYLWFGKINWQEMIEKKIPPSYKPTVKYV